MHLIRITSRALAGCLLLGLTACGGAGDLSSGGAPNINWNWPAHLIGEAIDFTVRDAGGASVAVGSVINYRFDSAGSVVGTNPESGNQYYPQSYTYSASGSSATITLDYGGGAYERYRLQASDCDSGSYRLESYSGTASANSSGSYRITTAGSCGGGPQPVDYDEEPNDTLAEAVAVPSPSLLSGSVNSAQGGDRIDYYALTPDASEEFSITLSDYGGHDLDLHVDDAQGNVLYSSASSFDVIENVYETLQAGTTYYVKVFAYDTAGSTVDYELLFTLGSASRGGSRTPGSASPAAAVAGQ